MNVELQPLMMESTLTIQKILEVEDHTARCMLLKHFMDVEKKRLDAKSTLQGMFAGDASAVTKEEDGATVIDTSVTDTDTDKDTDADADSSSSTDKDKDTAASDKK